MHTSIITNLGHLFDACLLLLEVYMFVHCDIAMNVQQNISMLHFVFAKAIQVWQDTDRESILV